MNAVFWLAQTVADVPAANGWLTMAERERMDRFCVPKRRGDWRLGRWTAKRALAAFLDVTPAGVEIRAAESGAPEAWVDGRPAPVSLSLSHSGPIGFCVVAAPGTDLGCDVEAIEPRSPGFLADYFTAEEQALVVEAPLGQRDLLLTLLWSAKESVLKALHCGLRSDTRSVHCEVQGLAGGRGWRRLRATHSAGRKFQGWWRENGGMVFTVAVSPGAEAAGEFPQAIVAEELALL